MKNDPITNKLEEALEAARLKEEAAMVERREIEALLKKRGVQPLPTRARFQKGPGKPPKGDVSVRHAIQLALQDYEKLRFADLATKILDEYGAKSDAKDPRATIQKKCSDMRKAGELLHDGKYYYLPEE